MFFLISELPWQKVYSAGKTSALLRGDASGANRCYMLAHCAQNHLWQTEQDNHFVPPFLHKGDRSFTLRLQAKILRTTVDIQQTNGGGG